MLETIIASKARAKLLKLFFLNEGAKFHIRDVSRRLGINVNQARKELIKLHNAGLLVYEETGNLHLYSVNKGSIFFNEISSIVKKSAGFEKIIREKLESFQGIRFAFIFGSFAQGDFDPSSDIDLMIIGKPDMGRLNQAIHAAEEIIERSIQYMVYPFSEFRKKRGYGFVKNVMGKKKVFLIGDSDGLERA